VLATLQSFGTALSLISKRFILRFWFLGQFLEIAQTRGERKFRPTITATGLFEKQRENRNLALCTDKKNQMTRKVKININNNINYWRSALYRRIHPGDPDYRTFSESYLQLQQPSVTIGSGKRTVQRNFVYIRCSVKRLIMVPLDKLKIYFEYCRIFVELFALEIIDSSPLVTVRSKKKSLRQPIFYCIQ
jgi:hypothetical protein